MAFEAKNSIEKKKKTLCFILTGHYDRMSIASVHMGIPVDLNIEANDTGRLETAPWSIDHIAHGDAQRGWCC